MTIVNIMKSIINNINNTLLFKVEHNKNQIKGLDGLRGTTNQSLY